MYLCTYIYIYFIHNSRWPSLPICVYINMFLYMYTHTHAANSGPHTHTHKKYLKMGIFENLFLYAGMYKPWEMISNIIHFAKRQTQVAKCVQRNSLLKDMVKTDPTKRQLTQQRSSTLFSVLVTRKTVPITTTRVQTVAFSFKW